MFIVRGWGGSRLLDVLRDVFGSSIVHLRGVSCVSLGVSEYDTVYGMYDIFEFFHGFRCLTLPSGTVRYGPSGRQDMYCLPGRHSRSRGVVIESRKRRYGRFLHACLLGI